jgi:hydrogenase-1 operon protein HyaE
MTLAHSDPSTVSIQPPAARELHALYERLFAEFGFANVTPDRLVEFLGTPGRKLLVFLDDPQRLKESLDLAVIAPELARVFAPHLTVGVLLPAAATAVAPKYGFRRWPALVVTDGAGYVGAVDGLRDWSDYVDTLGALMQAPVTRPPSIGVALRAADGGNDAHCR